MAEYLDYSLNVGSDGLFTKYTDKNAIVLAIKNLLLSRPGNFPMHPSFGMNIAKYQFEVADDVTVSKIKSELNRQIGKYIPSISDVDIQIQIVENEETIDGIKTPQYCLAISISASTEKDALVTNFLVINEKGIARVINETY